MNLLLRIWQIWELLNEMRLWYGEQGNDKRIAEGSVGHNKPLFTEIACMGYNNDSMPDCSMRCINRESFIMAKKYDWKKTAWKVGIVAGEIIIAGIIAYIADKPALIFLAPVFEGILDYLKHKN